MANTTFVIDPVCGMTISEEGAVVVEYRRTRYHFCEAACAAMFRDEPERWVQDEFQPLTSRHSHPDQTGSAAAR